MHLAESEKERMVTYYFRGMNSNAYPNEYSIIVPSSKVPTYDSKPEMSALEIVKEFEKVINKDEYNFILINFANPDMVAHSGNIKATIKAIECVDRCLGEVVRESIERKGTVIITADHC